MSGNKTPFILALLLLVVIGSYVALGLVGQKGGPDQGAAGGPGATEAPQAQGGTGMGMGGMGGGSQSNNPNAQALTRSDSGDGGVIAAATMITDKFVEADNGATGANKLDLNGKRWFMISLNTHTVDMSGFDVPASASLKTSSGKEVKAEGDWVSIDDASGHHRSGFISFDSAKLGLNDWDQDSGWIELTIKDLAGVPQRTFRWDLPITYPSGS